MQMGSELFNDWACFRVVNGIKRYETAKIIFFRLRNQLEARRTTSIVHKGILERPPICYEQNKVKKHLRSVTGSGFDPRFSKVV